MEPATTSKCAARQAKLKAVRTERRVSSCMPHDWTEEEKLKLAISLEKHGIMELDKVVNDVPTKTPGEVKFFVESLLRKTRKNIFGDPRKEGNPPPKAPIDEWLSWFNESQPGVRDVFSECLAKTYLYISRYEIHPDPEDCDGVDFAAMYEFLYLAFSGNPVKAVNPPTARAILQSLDELKKKIEKAGTENELEHLEKVSRLVFVDNNSKRQYGKKATENKEPSGPVEKLLEVKGVNPLNIPYELLKRPGETK